MNRVILMGRLTRDPVISKPEEGAGEEIARYTLAVDRRKSRSQQGQQADYVSCVAFGKSAEFTEKYLHKGTKICVEGRISTGSYTNRQGEKVYTTSVVIETCEFAESKKSREDQDDFMRLPEGLMSSACSEEE